MFDQYDQPENKLTHALVMTLTHDRKLLRPFLDFLDIREIPSINTLSIIEQQIPGSPQSALEEDESKGLPDACVFSDNGWAVLFECKIQAQINAAQIRRHRNTAIRHDFKSPHLIVIAVDKPDRVTDSDVKTFEWKELYSWFSHRMSDSFWAREFVRYMQTFEQKMLAKDYDIRGTITVFDGIRFDADNPYTYREGKRLIRLLGDLLQARKDLHKIGVDPKGERRSAITGKGGEGVWDFLPLVASRNAKQFTDFPHLTIALRKAHTIAAVTIPNGVKGG
ncbi:MAG TPA: hypothetical protein VMM56_13770, partial [Planctomycetaceae bacterium]|nr:hypothetical protein [Planctomycetaceae bacterium]